MSKPKPETKVPGIPSVEVYVEVAFKGRVTLPEEVTTRADGFALMDRIDADPERLGSEFICATVLPQLNRLDAELALCESAAAVRRVDVAAEFDPYLGGRDRASGPGSGEALREDVLLPALDADRGSRLEVDLNGVKGCGPSGLEEAFGGLVRARGPAVAKRVKFVAAAEEAWTGINDDALSYLRDAADLARARAQGEEG